MGRRKSLSNKRPNPSLSVGDAKGGEHAAGSIEHQERKRPLPAMMPSLGLLLT
jgi:hypothetical protein